MKVGKIRVFFIKVAWLCILPYGIWMIFGIYPPPPQSGIVDILAFLLLIIILAIFPVTINKTPILFIQGVSLAAFLTFGLFVEVLLTQAAILALTIKVRVWEVAWIRIPINMLMFFLISVMSSLAYYWFGGSTDPAEILSAANLWPVLAYILTYFAVNQLLIFFIVLYIYKKDRELWGRDILWEMLCSIIVFPIGLALFALYQKIGSAAVLCIGIPLVCLAVIMQTYYSSIRINEYLHKAGEISRELAERLTVHEVLRLFADRVSSMFQADHLQVFNVTDDSELEFLIGSDADSSLRTEKEMAAYSDICRKSYSSNNILLFHDKASWSRFTKDSLDEIETESLMVHPIIRNSNVVGVLLLGSERKRAFEKFQKTILDILCSSFAIAIENAKHYEETKRKSEHCSLTGAYNHGHMKGMLERYFWMRKNGQMQNVSAVLIDLDHFKNINDTYGHENGDIVLVEMTKRMQKLTEGKGMVFRCGGEEFLILLPEHTEQEALCFAEDLRKRISETPVLADECLDGKGQVSIQVTASIGVAAASEGDTDSLELMRNADSAMYLGAKKAGRNRVAVYPYM